MKKSRVLNKAKGTRLTAQRRRQSSETGGRGTGLLSFKKLRRAAAVRGWGISARVYPKRRGRCLDKPAGLAVCRMRNGYTPCPGNSSSVPYCGHVHGRSRARGDLCWLQPGGRLCSSCVVASGRGELHASSLARERNARYERKRIK